MKGGMLFSKPERSLSKGIRGDELIGWHTNKGIGSSMHLGYGQQYK